jgi:hypothetical protein
MSKQVKDLITKELSSRWKDLDGVAVINRARDQRDEEQPDPPPAPRQGAADDGGEEHAGPPGDRGHEPQGFDSCWTAPAP